MSYFKKVTLFDWQIGLIFRHGVFVRQVGAGQHTLKKYRGEDMLFYDTRPSFTQVFATEMLTSDKMGVTVSASIPRRIVDPKKLIENSVDNEGYIRSWATEFLKHEIGARTIDVVADDTDDYAQKLQKHLAKKLEAFGIEIADDVTVSIVLPRSIKRAFEQEIVAKKKALADLEEARGKTAVLRHLANSAKMVEEHPTIYKLLLSQKVRSLSVQLDEKQK